MSALQTNRGRMGPSAGIAIGPILFIIAILAILASAIAAGSGSFTGGTGAESNKTKSAALVQIGENLKMGMDQITMEVGIGTADVDINVDNTSENNMLFSPSGGGIAPPSVGMANDPRVDKWRFPKGPVAGFGSTSGNEVLAVLPVSYGVCAEINNRSMGTALYPGPVSLGNFYTNVVAGSAWPTNNSVTWYNAAKTADASGGPTLKGVATGCVQNADVTVSAANGPSTQFFFYQVLSIQ